MLDAPALDFPEEQAKHKVIRAKGACESFMARDMYRKPRGSVHRPEPGLLLNRQVAEQELPLGATSFVEQRARVVKRSEVPAPTSSSSLGPKATSKRYAVSALRLDGVPCYKRPRRVAPSDENSTCSYMAQRLSITTSRYSLGKTNVRSCDRLPCSSSARMSRVKAVWSSGSSAPNVLVIGP